MLLERIYDEDLAQASYFIGCQQANEAIVIDPRRDISVYLELAAAKGMRITHVTETHIHADFLSGTRELAEATGAQIWISGEGDADWRYDFAGTRLHDGDEITVGKLRLIADHTPGHTPEHLSFRLIDGATADKPGFYFTGDFVFVGDLGRPDLLDEAAGGVDTRFAGAKQLFASLRDKLGSLPDYVQILPGHGSGSACGKALGAVPSTTVGYERAFSWWSRYVENDDEQGFIAELLDGQPDAHAYFGRMKRENRDGPAVIGQRPELAELDSATVAAGIENGKFVLVDTRSPQAVHEGTARGAINLPNRGKLASHGAWAIDPETDVPPLVLLAEDAETAQQMWDHLVRVGIDSVAGYVTSLEGLPSFVPETVAPADLDSFEHDLLLDVRNATEFAAGSIPGAKQLSAGRVLWHQDELPAEGTIVSFCQSGMRNSVAASALRRAGFHIVELEGSYLGWQAAQK